MQITLAGSVLTLTFTAGAETAVLTQIAARVPLPQPTATTPPTLSMWRCVYDLITKAQLQNQTGGGAEVPITDFNAIQQMLSIAYPSPPASSLML